MVPPNWLSGIRATVVAPGIWEIEITGYGPADVGAYADAVRYADRLRLERLAHAAGRARRNPLPAYAEAVALEAHHVVGREHLEYTRGPYSGDDAPAVVISAEMHRKLISPRITAEQNVLGGRPRDGRASATPREVLKLYKTVYTWHTPFVELYHIARNVIG